MICLRAVTVAILLAGPACAQELFDAKAVEFISEIDTEKTATLPVQQGGRITILDTVARENMSGICGEKSPQGLDPCAAWLELYFNSGEYLDRPVIYIKEEMMRRFLAEQDLGPAAEAFKSTSRIPPGLLIDREGLEILLRDGRLSKRHLERFERISSLEVGDAIIELYGEESGQYKVPIDRLNGRFNRFLAFDTMKVIPTSGGIWRTAFDAVTAGEATGGEDTDEEEYTLKPVVQAWVDLHRAWLRRDVEQTNKALDKFAGLQREADTEKRIPPPGIRSLEIWFNLTNKFAIVWVGFAIALVLIIPAAVNGNRWLRISGLSVMAVSTLVLATGFCIRWILSGREWYLPPLMNQYEAVMGSALLAALGGLVIELISRRNYVGLSGAFYALVALLSCHFLSGAMGGDISNPAGILNSVWMAVHVAVIVIGHAFVGMAFVISMIYIVAWIATRKRPDRPEKASAPPDLSSRCPPGTLATVDRCNLITSQIACWTVSAGTILGAVWADVAWGRWWGWDPKETWALITALIFVVLLHLRFATPARSRGLVTAVCCVVGCLAMLFNWIIVNYFLSGMHSYA